MKHRQIVKLNMSIKDMLPERNPDGHKGTFGKAFIYSGSYGSAGCAILAGKAAYRVGAGMVKISSPDCNRVIIQTSLPEALYDTGSFDRERMENIRRWSDVYLAGPGIGTDEKIISEINELILGSDNKPIVIDADAITIISSDAGSFIADALRQQALDGRQIILTPHEGELHRLANLLTEDAKQEACRLVSESLADSLCNDVPGKDCSRLSLAIAVSEYLGCTVVAKGPDTYVVSPDKDIYLNDDCGNSGMATAGTLVPFFQIGWPLILNFWFDMFEPILQAYIFVMLTMVFIDNGRHPVES